ncbi:MAG: hypothetical protein ACRBCL_08595 [Maritimibacter sp.]
MSMNNEDRLTDDALDAFFAAAKSDAPTPSDALMTAIMQDAIRAAEGFEAVKTAPARGPKMGLWATLMAVLGGWPAVAGMATATVAGVWIGAAAPQGVSSFAGGVLMPVASASASGEEYELDEFVPGYAALSVLDGEMIQ